MKTASILLGLLGLTLIIGFTTWLGAGAVTRAMLSVGSGGFALLVLWQLATDGVLALAWRTACPRVALDTGFGRLLLARMVREAGISCLPFSQVGGILIGMRATGFGSGRTMTALAWPTAVAANIVDITTEVIGQIGFVLVGLLFLLDRKPGTDLAGPLGLGTILGIAAVAGFIWAQRSAGGLFRRGVGLLGRHLGRQTDGAVASGPATGDRMLGRIDNLQDRLNQFYARPGRIAVASLVQLVGWIGGAAWVWLAYRLLGAPVGWGMALAIEGVASGILSLSFLMPAALGVQEGAYVALGSLFGIDPHLSFGLSLLRRARDLAIGVPTLLWWQWMEVRRLRRTALGRAAEADAALDRLSP